MSPGLTPKDKIQILVAEYATLRSEIIQRSTWQVQMAAIGGAAAAVVLSVIARGEAVYLGVFLLFFIITSLAISWLFNERETREVIEGVKTLERKINRLAGQELLLWETRKGIPAVSYTKRWARFLSGS
jgi:hypothetical protein